MIGKAFGAYQVLDKLGEGGMGQVFRARDTRLGRDVALKVLPESFAQDADRRGRLEREARVLASLNHPHIAAIHGIEESAGEIVLVLELVEGLTVADRLQQGPFQSTEALTIARQIAEALDAAHERGIVHRDLKPANIKLAPDRGVKVLDFGLAKAISGNSAGYDLSQLPTVTAAATREGMILGTPAYMSPEQARGLPLDKRTDIWAFGCVLYEMLTGRLAFGGVTLTDTLVAVLEREPDWSALPSATPAPVRRLLRRCLDKDPRRRLRDIGDAAIDLSPAAAEATVVSRKGVGARPSPFTLGLVALALVLVTAVVTALIAGRSPVPAGVATLPVRFSIAPPPGTTFGGGVPDVETTQIALSPDGSQLAFVATPAQGARQIWVQPLSSLEARRIAGTEGATSVFWSPDSSSIGFFAAGKLNRLDLPNGAPVALADVPTTVGLFGTWGEAGRILFASIQGSEILHASTSGEPPVSVVKAEPSRREGRLFWPSFLPDGKQFLYNARLQDGTEDVRLAEPGGATRSLFSVVSNVEWIDPGYLVFARDGTLLAQRVDLAAGRVTGDPVAVADSVNYSYTPSRAMFTTSRTGTIIYQSHRDVTRLTWFDRSGKELETLGDPAHYTTLRLSPDGKLLLFTRVDSRYGTNDLWLRDLERGTSSRETSGPPPELVGPWLPGRRRYIFSSARSGPPTMFEKDLTTGTERELLPTGGFQLASDVTPDGKLLLLSFRKLGGGWDIYSLPLSPAATPSPLVHSSFSEFDARLSPDARTIVYTSDESGRTELYAAPFPLTGAKILVSSGGASTPRWSRDTGELFYLSADRQLMTVAIRTTPTFEVGTPRALFTLSKRTWTDFDVSPDGKRFLTIVPERLAREQPLTVILNWRPDAKR